VTDSNLPVYALAVAAIAALVAYTHYDYKKWQEFAAQHECRKVGALRADRDGEWTRSAYVCNDGVTYWR